MLQTGPGSSLTGSRAGNGPVIRSHSSVHEIGRSGWESCLPDDLEGFAYHSALERSRLEGFTLGYYVAWIHGRPVCVVPHFTMRYDLATTAQGRVRSLLAVARRWVPGQLTLGLSCLGSPETEFCQIGFDASLDHSLREEVLRDMLAFWRADAQSRGIGLLGIKDLSDADRRRYDDCLRADGYGRVASLPGAVLPVDFASVEDYIATLGPATRKDLRRKLRQRGRVEVEYTRDISAILPQIMAMYRETRDRSDWVFEEMSEDYFRSVVSGDEPAAIFAIYRHEGRIVAANLLIEQVSWTLDKLFLMHAAAGRQFNLYFLSWIENIERCIRRGCKTYVAGAAAYDAKLRLGCVLQRKWIYFRHRRALPNLLLRTVSPALAVDQPVPPDADCWEQA